VAGFIITGGRFGSYWVAAFNHNRWPLWVAIRKLALYLTKYIGKEMDTELNERRYRTSLNIEIPKETIMVPAWIDAKGYALFRLERIAGKIGRVWCPEESYGQYGWACSWA